MFTDLKRRRRVFAYRLSRRSRRGLRAGLGGGVALFVIVWLSSLFVGVQTAGMLVASMGASAVLLFSAPQAPLSQPWNLVAGQVSSALIGVTCAQGLGTGWLAASAAVAGAIAIMAVLNCTHPPGGATALSAVVGGPAVTELGFHYVLTPVAINSLLILCAAVAIHRPKGTYPRRRPRRLVPRTSPKRPEPARLPWQDCHVPHSETGSTPSQVTGW